MFALGNKEIPEKYDGVFELKFSGSYYQYPIIVSCDNLQPDDNLIIRGIGQRNCVVILSDRFYHTFTQTLGVILQEFKEYPDTQFYLIQGTQSENLTSSHITFLFDILRKHKIKNTVVNLGELKVLGQTFLIKDFFYYSYPRLTDTFITDLYEISKPYQSDLEPHRKVYCSRKKTKYQRGKAILGDKKQEDLPYKDDVRLDDETKLEEYFISKGFEVVYPEDFDNLYDQIRFFSSVHTLISVTSAALMNMCFMKPGTAVIELTGALMVNGEVMIHNHYQPISWAKEMSYMSVPSNRSTDYIIKHIEDDRYLKKILEWRDK